MESGVEKHKFVTFSTFLHFFSLLSLLGTFSSPAGRDSIELQTKSQFWNFLFSKVRIFLKNAKRSQMLLFRPRRAVIPSSYRRILRSGRSGTKKCEECKKYFSRISPFRHPKYQLFRGLEWPLRIYFWNVFKNSFAK